MALQSTSKSPHLGSRPRIKEYGSILDLTSNQELDFAFFLFRRKSFEYSLQIYHTSFIHLQIISLIFSLNFTYDLLGAVWLE